ncbi:MAG TPA: FAD-binding oxidoreductase [Thermoleophilaceae bacterium]|nr:FAD-binding oxidoreductase [Thermoleophilaceae bacterium]
MTDAATASPDLEPLRSQVSGKVSGPEDRDWDEARQAWNLAVDQRPVAVVFATGADDVAATVRFAAGAGVRVTAQGSGHAASSHDTLADTILIKTNEMTGLEIDAGNRTARVEAGVLAGDLSAQAGEHGLAPLGGSSADVGVVGYTLGGGLGWLGRLYGFASNAVRSVEIVTADGELVRADAGEQPDLFWAVRGGGGSFGIVIALDVNLVPLGELFAGGVMYDVEHAPAVFRAYRDWARQAPAELTSSVRFLTPPPIPDVPEPIRGRPMVVVTGAHAGDPAEGEQLFAPMRELAEPVMDMFGAVPPAALCRINGDPENPVPGIGGRSIVIADLSDEAIDALVALCGAGSGSPLLTVDLRHLGGALAEAPEGAGVLGSLEGEFAIAAVGVPMGPNTPEAITGHLDKLYDGLEPFSTGGTYLNFTEVPSDGSTAFGEDAQAELRRIKAELDPDRVIRGGRDVGPG